MEENDERYQKITPEQLFITILEREPTEAERWTGVESGCTGHRPTGNNFIDLFARLVRKYGKQDGEFFAQKMGVERDDLYRAMIAMTGLSLPEWVNRYLLLAATELLEQTDLSITAIAKRLGFSIQNFTDFFKKYRKLSPKQWRQRRR